MTYNVFGGTLNPTLLLRLTRWLCFFLGLLVCLLTRLLQKLWVNFHDLLELGIGFETKVNRLVF